MRVAIVVSMVAVEMAGSYVASVWAAVYKVVHPVAAGQAVFCPAGCYVAGVTAVTVAVLAAVEPVDFQVVVWAALCPADVDAAELVVV